MTFTTTSLSAAALSSLFIASGTASAFVDDVETYKPGQVILFNGGNKHGAGYFPSETWHCKFVLTIATDLNWDNPEDSL